MARRYPRVIPPKRDRAAGVWIVEVRQGPLDSKIGKFSTEAEAMKAVVGLRSATDWLFPAEFTKPDPGSLRGPYFDRDAREWRLIWRLAGVEQRKSFGSRQECAALRAELAQACGPAPIKPLPAKFRGTPEEWRRAKADCARAASEAAALGHQETVIALRKYSSILADLSSDSTAVENTAKLIEKLRQMTAFHRAVMAGRASYEDGDSTVPEELRDPASTLAGDEGLTLEN